MIAVAMIAFFVIVLAWLLAPNGPAPAETTAGAPVVVPGEAAA
jgi:hypothetical protein